MTRNAAQIICAGFGISSGSREMRQSRLGSLREAATNIGIGFSINWCLNMAILPRFGWHTLTGWTAFKLGLVFTVISLIRQYVIRRYFNGWRFRFAKRSRCR